MVAIVTNYSHSLTVNLEQHILNIKNRLEDRTSTDSKKALCYLSELKSFDFGRFLLERQGLNGYWTHQILTWPERENKKEIKDIGSLEEFIYEKAPVCLATQERFQIFKKIIQDSLKPQMTCASIPSGLMGDFLTLDASILNDIKLIGIDLDPESIQQAKDLAKSKGISNISFYQMDVLSQKIDNELDVISSNGLNIYLENREDRVKLYKNFSGALKPNGFLLTSYLSRPPTLSPISEWKLDQINLEDLSKQKLLFKDVINVKWQVFISKEEMLSELREAGFASFEFFYDKAHVFPTIVAKK